MRLLFILLFYFAAPATIGFCAYEYYYAIPIKIEKNIKNSLLSLGFKKVSFGKTETKSGSLTVHDISLDSKSFSGISSLTIRYSLKGFFFNHQKADKLEIKNLRLTGEMTNDMSLLISGWKNNEGLINKINGIPAKRIIFQDGNLDVLAQGIGGLKIEYEGEIKQSEGNNLEIEGLVYTTQKKMEAKVRLSGILSDAGGLNLRAQCDTIKIESDTFTVRRGNFNAELSSTINDIPHISMEAGAGSLIWKNLPLQDTNFTLEKNNNTIRFFAEGKTTGNKSTEFSLQETITPDGTNFEATIYPTSINELVKYIKASNYLKNETSLPSAFLSIEKPMITLEGKITENSNYEGLFKLTPPSNEYEITGDFVTDNSGVYGKFYFPRSFVSLSEDNKSAQTQNAGINGTLNLSGSGVYQYTKNNDISDLKWKLDGLIEKSNISLHGFPVKNLQGNIELENQKINNEPNDNFKKISFEIPIRKDIHQQNFIELDNNQSESTLIKNLKATLFDGEIVINNLPSQFTPENDNFTIEIGEIDLGKLSLSYNLPNFLMSGKLGGKIPIRFKNGNLEISHGLIQSQEAGIIQFPEEFLHNHFPGYDEKMTEFRDALKNFHYEFFEFRLNGPVYGPVTLNFLAKGTYPKERQLLSPVKLEYETEIDLAEVFKPLTTN